MAEKVLKVGMDREDGFLYYIDKDGDIARVQMARGGKKGGPGRRFSEFYQNRQQKQPVVLSKRLKNE